MKLQIGVNKMRIEEIIETFSHTKSIVDKKTWMDLPMRYQLYDRKIYKNLLKLFLR